MYSHMHPLLMFTAEIPLTDLQFHILMNVVYKESMSNCEMVK